MTSHRNNNVKLLRWPQHAQERAWCHEHRIARILLIEPGQFPPEHVDVYEDWVRPPVPPEDLEVRARVLASRRQNFNRPEVDPHGILIYQDQRLAISPTQVDLASCLIRNFGQPVLRAALVDCLPGAAQTSPRRNVLDLHIGRLRRKIAPTGLTIRTIWGCGYLLEALDSPSDSEMPAS